MIYTADELNKYKYFHDKTNDVLPINSSRTNIRQVFIQLITVAANIQPLMLLSH